MARIIDLDAVVPEAVEVQVGGVVYELPGDIPVPTYLELSRLLERVSGEDAEAAEEAFVALSERVEGLFLGRNDSAPELGPKQLGALVVALYEGLAEEDSPDPPKPAKRAGTPNTRRRKTTARSRSSR